MWKTLWKTSCINIHHFCINIHPLHKYTFCTKKSHSASLYQFQHIPKTAQFLTKSAPHYKSRANFAISSASVDIASHNTKSCKIENQLESSKTHMNPNKIRHSS